jgi:hypothetical protein
MANKPDIMIPEMIFGDLNDPIDWRKFPDTSPDDDTDVPASDELIQLLGFDPDQESWE